MRIVRGILGPEFGDVCSMGRSGVHKVERRKSRSAGKGRVEIQCRSSRWTLLYGKPALGLGQVGGKFLETTSEKDSEDMFAPVPCWSSSTCPFLGQ